MGKLIVIVLLLAAAGGGYYLWKSGGDVKKAVQDIKHDAGTVAGEASGFPAAKTPKEAVDLFTKAIKERKYDMAAKYCTSAYADELKRANKEAEKLGEALDNLTSQMASRNVANDEMRWVLFYYDPFPKDFTITVEKPTDTEAVGVMTPPLPQVNNQQAVFDAKWNVDDSFMNALYPYPPLHRVVPSLPQKVKMVKEGEEWKFDFPDPAAVQQSVTRIKNRGSYYANQLTNLSSELKTDASTQSQQGFKARLKTILEEAKSSSN
jgi:hypothetical protein